MSRENNKFFIVILGPTGVGKTDFVHILSKKLKNKIEVVNGDMGQMYTPISIGTAKPDLKKEIVPHHMFDILNTPENFSTALYRNKVEDCMIEIWQRDHIPVIVGGSNFYVESLFIKLHENKSFCESSNEQFGKNKQISDLTQYTTTEMWDKLHAIDPVRANDLYKTDRYRIERALKIWYSTGVLPSECKGKYNPIAPAKVFFLSRDKDDLHARINLRTNQMLSGGWLEEVQALSADWHEFLLKKRLIGYPEILEFLSDNAVSNSQFKSENKNGALIKLAQEISQQTRSYAKRQLTFYKRFKKNISQLDIENNIQFKNVQFNEVNLTLLDLELYIDELVVDIGLK